MAEIPFWKSITQKKKEPETIILEKMQDVRVFEGIPERSLKFIRSLCHIRYYHSDQHVFRSGEPGVGMYIILEGRVEIYRMEGDYKRSLQVLTTGDSFGELGLLEDIPRSASAIAMEDTSLLGFFRPDLETIMARKPRLSSKILFNLSRVIGDKLVSTNEVLERIAHDHEDHQISTH